MGRCWSLDLPEPSLSWCARQLGQSPEATAAQICNLLNGLVADYQRSLGIAPADDQQPLYARRLWICVDYHWRRLAQAGTLDLASLVARIQTGDIALNSTGSDLLRDVTLAQALELHDSRGAEVFEQDYMPVIRWTARRLSGARGEDLVENFAAHLVLPLPGRPPRISRYQGRTSLAGWLRVVTVNYCTSAFRQRDPRPLVEDKLEAASGERSSSSDRKMCQELLSGLIQRVLSTLPDEDRLLIRMLVLDGVPQGQLARSLGIHSGSLTRRRQRIGEAIWQGVKHEARQCGRDRAASDCLELIVVGGDRQLSQSLASVLAQGLQGEQTEIQQDAAP